MKLVDRDSGAFHLFADETTPMRMLLRLSSSEIKRQAEMLGFESRDYLWYQMTGDGYTVVEPQELEAQYQETLQKEHACKLN